ncbi:MAG: choice-of-anchor H family protein [Woeseia sp.]
MSIADFSSTARFFAAALFFFIFSVADAEMRAGDGEAREAHSRYYDAGGRGAASPVSARSDQYSALVTAGKRTKPGGGAQSSKLSGSAKGSNDFWIYHADVELFHDDDRDGYFYGIDLLFDADTYYEVAEVYAVLYLSYEGGPWNEYAATDTFSLYGATSEDEYVVVTELASGYPSGSYDLLIELYDTFDGSFVAGMGPDENPELSFLPLEDFNRDEPRHAHGHHGGGALDWPGVILAFAFVLVCRSRRRGFAKHAPRRAWRCA